MKLWQKITITIVAVVALGLVIYPNIVIDTGDRLLVCNYDGDFSGYDENHSYNEVYCYNENHIDLAKLIEGKKAIISNTRYTGNNYDNGIFYKLDGRHEEMWIFYVDDLLVVQVGSPDELQKFIAYK